MYFMTDSELEVARLVEQDRLIARALGGLLPEQTDQAAFVDPLQRVLDVACGSGGWALQLAHTYPHLQVMGLDRDANMIAYARTLALVGRRENASFQVMDARLPLDYPDTFFDLVNARWLSVIGRDAWPQVLAELFRVTRPGGFIRLTETEDVSVTTSPACERMMVLFLQALTQADLTFSATGRSACLAPKLPFLLHRAGYGTIQRHASILDWSTGTAVHQAMATNLTTFFRVLSPFLVDKGAVRAEAVERLLGDIEIELFAPDFCAFWTLYTVWGQKPHQ